MSSLFNLPTSDSIPDPSSATDRITLEEVAPRSSSLDGAVTIEFTSSPSRWFSPSDSYLVIGCNVHAAQYTAADAAAGTAAFYSWDALAYNESSGVAFARNAGAAFFSTVSLQVNGVLMGTISNPAQIGGVLTMTESTREYLETVGSNEFTQIDKAKRAKSAWGIPNADNTARTAFEIIYRPPMGFLRTMKAFPGARITLTFNVAPEYGSRVITSIDPSVAYTAVSKDLTTPTAMTDVRVQLTSLKYYAAMMTPLNNPTIPSNALVPMYEIASSAHQLPVNLAAASLQTISFNVPASTFKIGIAVQPASVGNGVISARNEISGFNWAYVQHLSVNYAGYQGGSGAYTNARNQPERPFADFSTAILAAQQGRASALDLYNWGAAPLYLFRFAKPANDVSSNATVRIRLTDTLTESVNVFCFAYYQSTAALSYDSSGMVTGAEYAYAS